MIGERELIYRDELYQILCKDKDHGLYVMHIDGWEDSTYFNGYGNDFLRLMNKATAVDAVEVVHGRWIDKYTNIVCSVCGAEYSDEIIFMNRNFKYENLCYCPSCGAKMDGGNI